HEVGPAHPFIERVPVEVRDADPHLAQHLERALHGTQLLDAGFRGAVRVQEGVANGHAVFSNPLLTESSGRSHAANREPFPGARFHPCQMVQSRPSKRAVMASWACSGTCVSPNTG